MIDFNYSIAGAVAGCVVGLTGVGGGALMTPILLLIFGVSPVTAVATDLWFAAITKLVVVPLHLRGGHVDWQVVRRMWLGSIPFAILAVFVVAYGAKVNKVDWLTTAVGIVVLIAAIGLLMAPILRSVMRDRRIAQPEQFKSMQPAITACAGAILAVLVTLTSVGAGAVGTVMMMAIYPLRMTPQRVIATDIAHAIPLAMVAGSGYLVAGFVDGWMLLSMLLGSIPAVLVGGLLSQRLKSRWLQIALAIVLLTVGVKTL